MMPREKTLALALVSALPSCAFKVVIPSEKTTVERQMIGEYAPLDDEIILYSVVRSAAAEEHKLSPVDLARLNQRFNLDEIDELKDRQIIGETAQGLIAILPSDTGAVSSASTLEQRLARLLVEEENRDRQVLFDDIISRSKDMERADLAKVRRNFAVTMRERIRDGHYYQDDTGEWKVKQGPNESGR